MKKLSCIAVLLFGLVASAQIREVSSLNEAKTIAIKDGKNIMIVFSGSDWCVPCMRLEKEILNQPEFKNQEAKKIVLIKVDFPTRRKNINLISKEQQVNNAKLFETYNPKGIFPLVVILDSKGKILAETSYKAMSSSAFATYIDNLISSK